MVILLRSTDGNPDSRLQKYQETLDVAKIPYIIICWDRDNKLTNTHNRVYYKKKAKYGAGWINLINLFGFNWFIIKQLFHKRKNIDTIHACDFDTILPAILMKFIVHKKVIYDIFDWYADSRQLGIAKYLVLLLESICLKCADVTIICEEERRSQLCCKPRSIWILPNIPNLKYHKTKSHTFANPIKISYVGVFASHRGLEKIISFVEQHPNIHLDIAGFGELQPMIEQSSGRCNNIHYYGSVEYEKGLDIMGSSDLILAIYETTIPNHIYAAPNKYYEGLFLGKPILTTKGTFVGQKTEKYNTGFVIGESYADMENCLVTLTQNMLVERQQNAESLWNNMYANFVDDFMKNKYIPFIQAKL